MNDVAFRRAGRARSRFDGQVRGEETEARRLSRLRAEKNRAAERTRKFRDRHGSDPCYVFACAQPSADEGLCRSHLRRVLAAPFVDGRRLHELVREWAERWEYEHEPNPSILETDLPARDALVERVARTGSRVTAAAIDTILRGERRRVEFYELADPIVVAIGRPFVFHDGTLEVFGETPVQEEVAA